MNESDKIIHTKTFPEQKTLADRSHFNYQRIYTVDRSSTQTKHVNEMSGMLKTYKRPNGIRAHDVFKMINLM